jgi:TRAP-type C4-dicarboxylate transport system, small permease component
MAVIRFLDENLELILMGILLGMMVLLSGMQVFFRYFVNSSLAWSEEMCRYCYVWSGFLSISYCVRKASSLKLDFIMSLLPKPVWKAAALVAAVFSIWIYAIFLDSAIGIIQKTAKIQQVSAAMRLPMQCVYMAAVVGFALAIARSVQMIVVEIRSLLKEIADTARRAPDRAEGER